MILKKNVCQAIQSGTTRRGNPSALPSKLSMMSLLHHCNNRCNDYVVSPRGILVPGGFGQRGTEGKIRAVKYARERKIPYLGQCVTVVAAEYIDSTNCGLVACSDDVRFGSDFK